MKPVSFLFLMMILFFEVNAQNIADYHLLGGFSIGDRYMDMTEVNSRYAFIGLGHIQPDKPGDEYSYNGKVKPFNNSMTFSGFITWKPVRKKGFNVTMQYDYLPVTTRKITVTNTYEINVMGGKNNEVIGIDTITDVIPSNSAISIQTISGVIGYDFTVGKVLFNVALGTSYNAFQIAGTSSEVSYRTYKPSPNWVLDPEYYPESYGIYAKANGFGFLVKFSASYSISSRLSAMLQFTTHAAEFPIDDSYYGKSDIWYQNSIPITSTYSINIIDYLSAQLSGIQISGGISYRLF